MGKFVVWMEDDTGRRLPLLDLAQMPGRHLVEVRKVGTAITWRVERLDVVRESEGFAGLEEIEASFGGG